MRHIQIIYPIKCRFAAISSKVKLFNRVKNLKKELRIASKYKNGGSFIQHHFYQRNGAGFTIIEMLIAMFIFSLIMGGVMGVFSSSIRVQRRTLVYQELLAQTSYAMEYMGRAVRMAKKDMGGLCIPAKLNYKKTLSGTGGIRFKNYHNECQEFFREWDAINQVHRLKEIKAGSSNYLTSPDLEVVSFNIGSSGWGQLDRLQPRVTLFLKIRGTGFEPGTGPEIKIQTTISQRDLDIRR